MPTDKTWQHWLERFYNLRRDKRGSHERPHKPVLLLAILDLLDHGILTSPHYWGGPMASAPGSRRVRATSPWHLEDEISREVRRWYDEQ